MISPKAVRRPLFHFTRVAPEFLPGDAFGLDGAHRQRVAARTRGGKRTVFRSFAEHLAPPLKVLFAGHSITTTHHKCLLVVQQ